LLLDGLFLLVCWERSGLCYPEKSPLLKSFALARCSIAAPSPAASDDDDDGLVVSPVM
jgi:hypothetical protein